MFNVHTPNSNTYTIWGDRWKEIHHCQKDLIYMTRMRMSAKTNECMYKKEPATHIGTVPTQLIYLSNSV